MADKINVLIPEETVDAKIKEIGEQISKDYAGKRQSDGCNSIKTKERRI